MKDMQSPRRIGVILAAGRGSRMGRTKQLIPWPTPGGPKPLVAAAYDAIRPACDAMVVVLGHDADAVAAALGDRAFQRVLSDPDQSMFESIRAGLRGALAVDASATIVLQPGDQPDVSPYTLRTLTVCSQKQPARAVIPQVGNHGGHPVFVPAQIAAILVDAECPSGLGDYWAAHPELCVRTPVNDPAVMRDVDTPADLR